jgi:glycosyltransferase involved in cell wall biosynthesis
MSAPTHPPIVLFTNSPFMGGMEEHVRLLGRGLAGRGYTVATICSSRDEIRALREGLFEAGVTVHSLAERGGSPLGALHRLRSLTQTLRRYPGCILHLHLTGHAGGELVQLAGRLAGVRAVVRTEHLPPVLPISAGGRAMVRLRDRGLDRIICVSEQTRQDHLDRLGRDAEKCTVVPNCVDLERFSPRVRGDAVRAELGLDRATPIVGTVSRLGELRKGIHHFLEMAAVVAASRPSVRFLIVGDGPLRAALERQARELGIGPNVVFTGERRDIPALLAAMHVFVMPSLYEGGPYTVLEAMAMARPVVATPVGLVPDVVRDRESGLLVRIGDSAALARGVLDILGDRALAGRLAQRGHDVVAARFSLDAMIDGVLDVYRRVAPHRSPAIPTAVVGPDRDVRTAARDVGGSVEPERTLARSPRA